MLEPEPDTTDIPEANAEWFERARWRMPKRRRSNRLLVALWVAYISLALAPVVLLIVLALTVRM